MPFALTIGVPYDTFFHLVPNELRAFYKSYKQRQQIEDEKIWTWMGNYGISAILVALDISHNGRKAKTKYIEEPIYTKLHKNDGLTEEEIAEKEILKAIEIEEQWIMASNQKGLPETII